MAQILTVTIADDIYATIASRMKQEDRTNRSEYVEYLIRVGLDLTKNGRN